MRTPLSSITNCNFIKFDKSKLQLFQECENIDYRKYLTAQGVNNKNNVIIMAYKTSEKPAPGSSGLSFGKR